MLMIFDHGGGFANLSAMFKKTVLRIGGTLVGWMLAYSLWWTGVLSDDPLDLDRYFVFAIVCFCTYIIAVRNKDIYYFFSTVLLCFVFCDASAIKQGHGGESQDKAALLVELSARAVSMILGTFCVLVTAVGMALCFRDFAHLTAEHSFAEKAEEAVQRLQQLLTLAQAEGGAEAELRQRADEHLAAVDAACA